jgi:hypothetical protein
MGLSFIRPITRFLRGRSTNYSPISVDNPVDNRFLVTETSPPITQLYWSAAFSTTGLQRRSRR